MSYEKGRNEEGTMSKEESTKITVFTDLYAWQESHKLVLKIYELTKSFPKEEIFALTSQIRRAAVSITSNIAEGFSRATSVDKAHFYTMAHGSLTEVQNQLIIAKDVNYVSQNAYDDISSQSICAHKLISGLIKATKAR